MRSRSIRYRTLFVSAGFSTVFCLLLPFVFLHRVEIEEHKDIFSRVRWIFELSQPLAIESLKSGSNKVWQNLVSTLRKLHRDPSFSRITLFGEDGISTRSFPPGIESALREPPPKIFLEVIGSSLVVTGPLLNELTTSGFLQVEFSTGPWKTKWNQLYQIVGLSGSALLAMTLIIGYTALSRWVYAPLESLESELTQSQQDLEQTERLTSEAIFHWGEDLNSQRNILEDLQETFEELRLSMQGTEKELPELKDWDARWNKLSHECSSASSQLNSIQVELGSFLKHSSEQIETVEEILKKSDLLTLNAFVEGNRAGEAGQGFSVVAESIRELSQKSGKVLKDFSKYWASAKKYNEELSKALENIQAVEQDLSIYRERQHRNLSRVDSVIEDSLVRLESLQTLLQELSSQSSDHPGYHKDLKSVPQSVSKVSHSILRIQHRIKSFLWGKS